jgi:hypothetical protein
MRIGFIRIAAVAAFAGALLAGVFVGAGIGSDNGPSATEVKSAVDAAGPGTRSADFAGAKGRPARSLYVQRTDRRGRVGSMLCIWDANPDGSNKMGGCNPETDPLGGHQVFANFTAEGGPPPDHPVSDARLSGLAAASVAALSLTMSDGSSRSVPFLPHPSRGYRAFAYRVGDADLAAGIMPVAVVATDAAGVVVDSVPTGFPQP